MKEPAFCFFVLFCFVFFFVTSYYGWAIVDSELSIFVFFVLCHLR